MSQEGAGACCRQVASLTVYLAVCCGAGFLWSAIRQSPGEPTIDWKPGTTAKPNYCKPGMPGCVPHDIQYVMWITAPESGNDAVNDFIKQAQSGPQSGGVQLAGCDLAGAMGDATYCFSGTGDHHAPDLKEQACSAQSVALGLLHQQPLFERLRCNLATGQYDFSLLYSLPKEVLERTLIVVTGRDPIQQTAAIHRVFAQLDPGRMCPGAVPPQPGADLDLANCTRISDFVRRGFAGAHQADALVRRLAGDYCCYQSDPFSDDNARIQAAFANFLRVGVVIDTSDMPSGLQYLAHVLGWPVSKELSQRYNELPEEQVAFEEERKLRVMMRNDYAIYKLMQQRVADQAAFLRAENGEPVDDGDIAMA